MRWVVVPVLLGAAGCAALPGWLGGRVDRVQPGLLAIITVSPAVDAQLSQPGVHAFCAVRWQRRADTLEVETVAPSPEVVSVRCNGEPVLLSRPTCTFTAHEAIFYAVTTPVVAIRCPYGAGGYITGFSKSQRGRP